MASITIDNPRGLALQMLASVLPISLSNGHLTIEVLPVDAGPYTNIFGVAEAPSPIRPTSCRICCSLPGHRLEMFLALFDKLESGFCCISPGQHCHAVNQSCYAFPAGLPKI